MLKNYFIFLLLLMCSKGFAQKNSFKVLQKNNIKEITSYLLESKTSTDSVLLSREFLNNKARTLKIELFDSIQNKIKSYEYKYRFDTLKIASLKYENDKLKIKTIYIYDKNNTKSQTIVYLNNSNENFIKYIFNKEGKVIEVKQYKDNKLYFLTEYKYFSFGAIKEKIVKYPRHLRSETRYRKTRASVELYLKTYKIFENYKNTNLKMTNTLLIFNRKSDFKTFKDIHAFEKKDELKMKTFYKQDDLIDYILQYKNDVFLMKKIFVYK